MPEKSGWYGLDRAGGMANSPFFKRGQAPSYAG